MNEPRALPRVSVIVLTHNRREALLATVAHLLALPEAPPVIVVDNASTDGTAAAVAACFPRVTLVRSEANLGAAGRNLGALRARTPYLAFSDDDTDWQAGALPRAAMLLDAFPAVGLVCARVCVGTAPDAGGAEAGGLAAGPGCAGVSTAAAVGAGAPATNGLVDDPSSSLMARSPLRADGLPGRPLLGFMAGACVMRRDLFIAMGGYRREFFIGGEEALLAFDLAAARWLMLYCADLVVMHRPSPLRDAGARRDLLARNRVWVAWMRLPLADALRETVAALTDLARAGRLRAGLAAIRRGFGWVLAERRVLPRPVVRDWRRVEAVRRAVEDELRVVAAAPAPAAITAESARVDAGDTERLVRATLERLRGGSRQPDDLRP